jgi:hypothetical protein
MPHVYPSLVTCTRLACSLYAYISKPQLGRNHAITTIAKTDNVPAWTGRRGQLSEDELWLVEVVNCTVVADLGPLAAHSGSLLKIVDYEIGLGAV